MKAFVCYQIRHQAAGILPSFIFLQPPSADQMEKAAAYCLKRHGDKHPKTGETYWLKVVEAILIAENPAVKISDLKEVEIPKEPEGDTAVSSSEAGKAALGIMEVNISAVGTVTNPGE